MWIVIKRKSDYGSKSSGTPSDPLCIKVDASAVADRVVDISNGCMHHSLIQIYPDLWIHADDVLSVQLFDENALTDERHLSNAKPQKRRLNEG